MHVVEQEKVEQRPSCTIPVGDDKKPCGSEQGIYQVATPGGTYPVCEKHIDKVVKDWTWETVSRPTTGKL